MYIAANLHTCKHQEEIKNYANMWDMHSLSYNCAYPCLITGQALHGIALIRD